ncbi:hypothetical protein [Klebsiella aerogenes]|uniref:Uncharacterized protein n=1 Tax=Klebsiella aerogenes TaxID=548 RepID=A0AAP9QXX4_KLEAE|nr:hypothetical protein [Klebsiella aerogenes]QMR40329.1 hypothetical protein HV331_12920 [Klebsiella aerogenes]
MNEIAPISVQTLPEDKQVIDFAKEIKKGAKPVIPKTPESLMPLGNCYWNANFAAKRNGGTMKTGWIIQLWPNSHLIAIHHAVHFGLDGNLYDVTQSPSPGAKRADVFIEDNSIQINLDKLPLIPCRFYTFDDNPFTKEYISAYKNVSALEKIFSKTLYDAGIRCEQQKAIAMGVQCQGSILSAKDVASITEVQRLMQSAIQNLGIAINNLKNQTTPKTSN